MLTFALIFALCLVLSLPSMDKVLARHRLAAEAEDLFDGFNEAIATTKRDLAGLPSLETLHCQNGMSELLAQKRFQNPFVDWAAISRNDEVVCRSGLVWVDMKADPRRLALDDTWSIVAINPGKTTYAILEQKRGDLRYVALFSGVIFDSSGRLGCDRCATHETTTHGNIELFLKPTELNGPEAVSYTNTGFVSPYEVSLTLRANQEFLDRFKTQGRIVDVGLATLAGLIAGLLVYILLARKRSLSYLIGQGIRGDEFVPFYQPVIDSRKGSVLGAEALIRWQSKDGKLIPPGQFIAYAEEHELIGPITDLLTKKVLADLLAFGWKDTDRRISINVTPELIMETEFCRKLLERLQKQDIPGKNLAIEITERRQFKNLPEARRALSCIVDAGIKIELDDAGTGFGGFSYIQELPISTLKIDKMFVDALLATGDMKRSVLDSIIEFAKSAQLDMVAEGVEQQEQVDRLREAGVYAIQGYVYAHPMSAKDFMRWMADREI